MPIQENGIKNDATPSKSPQSYQMKTKPKAPPPPPPTKNGIIHPPPCPPPDYDTISISSSNSSNSNTINNKKINDIKQNGFIKTSQSFNDSVEMESLESFKLNQPTNIKPKPPNTYFNKQPLSSKLSNGSITSNTSATLKKSRPVSVTIGEYPSGTTRKQPTRFDFLPNGSQDRLDGSPVNQPISSQFASELAQTLNRSNLRKRTESMVSIFQ